MSIKVVCPHCGKKFQAPEEYAGRNTKCLSCNEQFLIESPSGEQVQERPVPVEKDNRYVTESGKQTGGDEDVVIEASSKYPNLIKYLGWCKSIARICTALYFIAAIALLVEALRLNSLGLFFAAPLTVGVGYVTYVFTLAGIDFIHVVVDIEANTRRP